jgi:hypothetical protein
MEGLDMEVSGTMSNTDCAPPTEEDARLLEEILNSKEGKEKGANINWPAFGESPIYEYGKKRVFCVFFHICISVGMVISTKAGKLILESRIGLDNS